MNFLRQVGACRNVLRLNSRTNLLPMPMSVTISHVTRTDSNRSHFINKTVTQPSSLVNDIARSLHNQNKSHIDSNAPSIGVLKQIQNNVNPYVRLVRFDRPIGKCTINI